MASLTDIRSALKATVKSEIPELNVYSEVSDVQQVPAVVVMPAGTSLSGMACDFNGAMGRGMDVWTLDLYVLVARTDGSLAQRSLDQYVTGSGPKSLRQIIYQNPALGLDDGTDAHAEGIREYGGSFMTAGIQHVGAVVRLTVRTPN
ncbi:hypothetical protein [Streptomyces atriruber]|uniref:hypothetical protein n=1 Tax=Streptomyces atriruber TaxID=545121 RepID=UPI0006E391BE|nr:hypothetical protein [Streptomyces atriruber]